VRVDDEVVSAPTSCLHARPARWLLPEATRSEVVFFKPSEDGGFEFLLFLGGLAFELLDTQTQSSTRQNLNLPLQCFGFSSMWPGSVVCSGDILHGFEFDITPLGLKFKAEQSQIRASACNVQATFCASQPG
jgi:hypothetical protein